MANLAAQASTPCMRALEHQEFVQPPLKYLLYVMKEGVFCLGFYAKISRLAFCPYLTSPFVLAVPCKPNEKRRLIEREGQTCGKPIRLGYTVADNNTGVYSIPCQCTYAFPDNRYCTTTRKTLKDSGHCCRVSGYQVASNRSYICSILTVLHGPPLVSSAASARADDDEFELPESDVRSLVISPTVIHMSIILT